MTESHLDRTSKRSEFILLGLFLGLGLLHALAYVFIVPPWQHYDEPTHFEVAWLTARLGRHPTVEDYDPEFSREVAQSMVDSGFYSGLANTPDLSADAQVQIPGYDQFEEQPLYYYLASLPLKLYQSDEIANELRAVRLVSVLLFLATIVAAWGIARTMTRPGHPLRWMVPAFVVLLPAFTDLMSAVNNDVLAVAAFSYFLWGAARLLKSGYTILNFTWVVLSMILVYYSKNTAYVAFALLPLVMVVALVPKHLRWGAWTAAFIIGLIGIAFSMKFDDAAYWHRTIAQSDPLRQKDVQAVHGDYALVLDTWSRTNPPWTPPTYLLLPLDVSRNLKDRPMTLGYWVWANQAVKINSPILGTPLMQAGDTIQVDQVPSFHAYHVTMPPSSIRMWLSLRPNPDNNQETRLYYDGFLLVDGHRPLDEAPQFTDMNGAEGTWGGSEFTNYLRNGSIEHSWPRVEPRLDNLLARILPDKARPSLILNSILDWPATQIMFRQTYQYMMETFWARFGWGHVPLSWPAAYQVLNWTFLLGLLGAVAGTIRHIRSSSWDWFIMIFLSAGLIWFADLVRGVGYFTSNDLYVPPSRYAFPAIIPIAVILCFGWYELARLIGAGMKYLVKPGNAPSEEQADGRKSLAEFLLAGWFIGALVLLAVLSLLSISFFYKNIG
ncbi:MAG: hypothetical protein A2Z16_12730 [Chloroflexi bacterium RBG_16_54_18]|nr:MAG: hypothetical protein A2Z16_12730 [Chloroflexi bacterium RBG_16_54_18]